MKKEYEFLKIEIIPFTQEDVLTVSTGEKEENEGIIIGPIDSDTIGW